jgi:BirA family biotin operon repressor/biotin-[acetyl-CoA-carboxylase] ligase
MPRRWDAVHAADADLERRLAATTRFQRLVHVPTCGSTQDLAAAEHGRPPAVYWADHQTAGRGRMQRNWHDEPGTGLAVTFRFAQPLPEPMALAAVAPVCVAQSVEPFGGRGVQLKWPNDVLIDGKKLAGVLIDAVGDGQYAVGIGINVNRVRFPRELEATATSLALATGRFCDRHGLLLAIAQRLEAALGMLARGDAAALTAEFAARLGLLGRRVLVDAGALHDGVLERLDLRAIVLDGGRNLPLGLVRSLRAAT